MSEPTDSDMKEMRRITGIVRDGLKTVRRAYNGKDRPITLTHGQYQAIVHMFVQVFCHINEVHKSLNAKVSKIDISSTNAAQLLTLKGKVAELTKRLDRIG